MKLRISNRRSLLKSFNIENRTTASVSKYVGAEVLTDRRSPAIGFKHNNGSGYKVLTFRIQNGEVICNDQGFEETSKHVSFS
jgi:hypothetical protein